MRDEVQAKVCALRAAHVHSVDEGKSENLLTGTADRPLLRDFGVACAGFVFAGGEVFAGDDVFVAGRSRLLRPRFAAGAVPDASSALPIFFRRRPSICCLVSGSGDNSSHLPFNHFVKTI